MNAVRNCQWITPPNPSPGGCSHLVVQGASYCPNHLARVYVPTQRNRQAAALVAELAGVDAMADADIEPESTPDPQLEDLEA